MTNTFAISTILILVSLFSATDPASHRVPGKFTIHKPDKTMNYPELIQDTSPIIAPGAQLQKISDQFKFTEGPAADKNGDVYFTDQPNNNIWKYDTKGKLTLFLSGAGRSNGLYIDGKGNIISCADENNELWQISKSKKTKVLVKDFNGKRLNGPNDLWIHPKGDIYFTDPFYKRDYWKHTAQEQPGQYLYYYNRKSGKVLPVDTTFNRPNGIVGTGDGK